jgi:hypothetical protein
MSEEQKTQAQEQAPETSNEEVKQEEKTFTQEQLNNIIESRIMAERRKYEKKIQEEENQKSELSKQKQLEEAKSKQELEKIMQQRIAEKETELNKYKAEIKKERVDKSILTVASSYKAISPDQVVALLKSEVQLSDDGRTEVLDNNGNVRYNSGSLSAIGGNSQKPVSIGDLDLNNPADRKIYAEMRKSKAGFKINPKLTINN